MARREKKHQNGAGLKALIREAVQTAMIARLRAAGDEQGEGLARELLQDEEFRQEFLKIARDAAREAAEGLRRTR